MHRLTYSLIVLKRVNLQHSSQEQSAHFSSEFSHLWHVLLPWQKPWEVHICCVVASTWVKAIDQTKKQKKKLQSNIEDITMLLSFEKSTHKENLSREPTEVDIQMKGTRSEKWQIKSTFLQITFSRLMQVTLGYLDHVLFFSVCCENRSVIYIVFSFNAESCLVEAWLIKRSRSPWWGPEHLHSRPGCHIKCCTIQLPVRSQTCFMMTVRPLRSTELTAYRSFN